MNETLNKGEEEKKNYKYKCKHSTSNTNSIKTICCAIIKSIINIAKDRQKESNGNNRKKMQKQKAKKKNAKITPMIIN